MKKSLALPALLALFLTAAMPIPALDAPLAPTEGPIITTVDDGLDLSPDLARSIFLVDRIAIAILGFAMLAMVMLWALKRYRRDPGLSAPFHTEKESRIDGDGRTVGTL